MSAAACTDCLTYTPAHTLRNALIIVRVCCLLRLRSIGKLKVSMHGPMKFAHSVLSPEGQANHEHLASKRAGPKVPGAKAASAPPPQSPPATAAVAGYPAATAAAVAATTVAAAPVAPKSSAQQK